MSQTESDDFLLLKVVENLKQPLLNIARRSELEDVSSLKDIMYLAESSIQLIDGYILGADPSNRQGTLEFEPVSVPGILLDTSNNLSSIAKVYGCELKLDIEGKFAPI